MAAALLQRLLAQPDPSSRKALIQDHFPQPDLSLAQVWKSVAQQAAFNGRYQEAVTVSERMLELGMWLDDHDLQAIAYWTRGNVEHISGHGEHAHHFFCLARDFYEQQGDALNLARLGVSIVAHLTGRGEYAAARRQAESSWAILEQSTVSADRGRLAGLANNLGVTYEMLGRFEEAIELYQRKIALWQAQPEEPRAPAQISRAWINLGVIKKRLRLWSEAELALETGRHGLDAQSTAGAQFHLDRARALLHLADLRARRGDEPDQVRAAFAAARGARAQLGADPGDLPDLLHLDLFELEWLIARGQRQEQHLSTARRLLVEGQATGQVRLALRAELLLARLQASRTQGDATAAAVRRVAEAARRQGDHELAVYALWTEGKILRESGRSAAAIKALTEATALLESTRALAGASDLIAGFLDDKLAIFRELAAMALADGDHDRFFAWMERGRARELVAALSGSAAAPPLDAQLRDLEHQLRDLRAAIRRPDLTVDQRRLQEIEVADVSRRARTARERQRALVAPLLLTLEQVRASLKPGTLLLNFQIIEKRLLVQAISRDREEALVELGAAPSLESVTRDLYWIQRVGQLPPGLIKRQAPQLLAATRRPLAAWYDRLLRPLANLLTVFDRLIVVPDGPLFRLPFEALYDRVAQRYLIETHRIVCAAGATSWALAARRSSSNATTYFGLGYNGSRLTNTSCEVSQSAAHYPKADYFVGDEATPARFSHSAAATARVIHVAAHAHFRGDNVLFSSIELAGASLATMDILTLRLQAELVVLSACDTGRGVLRGGDYLGLAQAFLLAGARAVLATHWTVDDQITADMLNRFHALLATGTNPADALHQIQCAMIDSLELHLRHPYYWAPFFPVWRSARLIQNG